jgi:hypothetical protein
MTFTDRVLGLVVAPAGVTPRDAFAPPASVATPARVGVLADQRDATAAAAAVALALMRRERGSCALAVSWGGAGDDPPPAGALPAAARLATRLASAGFAATAAGHLVRVLLEGDADAAAGGWRSLRGEEVPAALALAGARTDSLDRELAASDALVVVAGRRDPDGLIAAARLDAEQIGPGVTIAEMRLGAAARGVLALGYGVPPRVKSAIDEALR